MKNLIYKELKLSIHPMCYIFASLLCLLFTFTPGVGPTIGFVYCIASFPFLLIGANKGRSTNDIYYSVLLPIRKADIVKGKMFSFIFLEVISIISIFLGMLISSFIPSSAQKGLVSPFTYKSFGNLGAIALIGFAIVNLIMCSLYFKNARSITLPTLISAFFMPIFMVSFGLLLPSYIMNSAKDFWNMLISPAGQIISLLIGLIIFAGFTVLTYFISSKRFSKSDQ